MNKLPRLVAQVSLDDSPDTPVNGIHMTVTRRDGNVVRFRRDAATKRWCWNKCGFCGARDVVTALFDGSPGTGVDPLLMDFAKLLAHLMDETHSFVMRSRESDHRRSIQRFLERRKRPPQHGFIYLIKHVNGLVKIGRSRKPKAREQTLQAEDPRLEMIGCFQAHNHIEKRLHSIFHDLRVRGEWFRLEDRHVEWIKLVLSNSESITQ